MQRGEGAYDVVVIGAGTAGLVTAAGMAAFGARVALVERGRMGGDCLNTGCVPSKALISSARLAHRMRHADRWGLAAREPRPDFARVFERMRERRARIAPHDSAERFESLGVDVFAGDARFVSPRRVRVGDRDLDAARFVVATGSRPAIPAVPGLESVRYFTNETIFDELREKPARLVIVGGGPAGCELGQAFARLGVDTTILQRAGEILPREDADAAAVVRRSLEADGVRIRTRTQAGLIARQDPLIRVWAEGEDGRREPLDCEALLVATGRAPNVEDLGLEQAGVRLAGGRLLVDDRLRTSQPHVFAAGDVIGPPFYTHAAEAQARIVVRNLLLPWLPARANRTALPACTFTDPELARVGLTEAEAARRGIAVDVYRQPFEELDRAIVESEETGFARVLTAKGGDRILGATIVSERAGDLVAELALAMDARIGLAAIARTIHAYPTYAEIARRLADARQRARLTPTVRRVFGWMLARRRRPA